MALSAGSAFSTKMTSTSSAAEGFDADGSRAGVEIDEDRVLDARGEDVEERLAQAVAGGACVEAFGGDEWAGAIGSGDDSHSISDDMTWHRMTLADPPSQSRDGAPRVDFGFEQERPLTIEVN